MGEAPLDPTANPNTPLPDYGSGEASAIQPTPTTDDRVPNPSELVLGEAPLPSELVLGEAPLPSELVLGEAPLPSELVLGEAPPPSELFLGEAPLPSAVIGEAPLFPSPTPVPTPSGGGEHLPSLPRELCSVLTVLVNRENGTLHSLLTVSALILRESVTFTCTAESNATRASSTVELAITGTGNSSIQYDSIKTSLCMPWPGFEATSGYKCCNGAFLSDNPFFVLRPPPSIDQVISREVVFTCGATAETSPSITWSRRREGQDEMVTPNERTIIDNVDVEVSYSTLTLTGLQVTDAGVYVCRASSNQSVSEVESYLHIRGIHEFIIMR